MLLWLVLIAIPLLFGLYAQVRVSSVYNRNLQIPSRGHITGRRRRMRSCATLASPTSKLSKSKAT